MANEVVLSGSILCDTRVQVVAGGGHIRVVGHKSVALSAVVAGGGHPVSIKAVSRPAGVVSGGGHPHTVPQLRGRRCAVELPTTRQCETITATLRNGLAVPAATLRTCVTLEAAGRSCAVPAATSRRCET